MKEETPITLDIWKVLAQLGLDKDAFAVDPKAEEPHITLETAPPSRRQ